MPAVSLKDFPTHRIIEEKCGQNVYDKYSKAILFNMDAQLPCFHHPSNSVITVKKILVVEDHKDSCLWISAVLRQCGYVALEAGDGAIAVRMARNEQPDLILLDMHLPAGGGEFVMESLHRQPELATIPIIVMTGDPDVDQGPMKSRGAIEVFRKPMDVHAFLQTIRRALNDTPATEDPTPRGAATRQVTGEAAADLLPA